MLPKPEKILDEDTVRNSLHQKIAATVVIALFIVGVAVGANDQTANDIDTQINVNPTETNTEVNNEGLSEIQLADYQEGYKGGYVDGRSTTADYGDNYAPPATVERRDAYALGYLEGFVKGCREGNFTCSEAESLLDEISGGREAPEVLTQ